MARERRVTVRLNDADYEAAAVHARHAGLAREGWGDGVSSLARECLRRAGAQVADELAAQEAPSGPNSSREKPRKLAVQVYRCPRDCDPSWRPTSGTLRCGFCRREVVPVDSGPVAV